MPFVSLMLFLDPFEDLVTCLDSEIPLRKKILSGIVYRYTSNNYKVTYCVKTFQHLFTRAPVHMESLRFPVVFVCKKLFLNNYVISLVHPLLSAALQPSFNAC